jgi:hypothetical protein
MFRIKNSGGGPESGNLLILFVSYDKVNTYAKSEMAQKYRIAVIAAIAVLSPA